MSYNHPLEEVLRTAIEDTPSDKVSLGDLLDLYDNRSFGPIFTLLGLLVVLPPLGAIPGLPAVCGVLIALFSLQMLIGRNHIWVPKKLERLSLSKDALKTAEDKSKSVLGTIDQMLTERLTWAISEPARKIAAALVTLLALIMIPLELVPFAVAGPGALIALFGIAILARDGALILAAFILTALGAGALGYFLVT
ncbi:exopolysaccharide biosynthesis protein [Woodsholea maritima]|uniref:exopolysaccharide biosynthesis protein n=1 Tax=Woodsholea maritima TaxID=240237 RepID=UPI00036925A5|nr:exopolysaccharide biosynthesis protein [Woodsholea maritima]